MTNEELAKLTKAYVKNTDMSKAELSVWASPAYVESRRKGESVTIVGQHNYNLDLWIVRHKDDTEGIYSNTELARNSRAE